MSEPGKYSLPQIVQMLRGMAAAEPRLTQYERSIARQAADRLEEVAKEAEGER